MRQGGRYSTSTNANNLLLKKAQRHKHVHCHHFRGKQMSQTHYQTSEATIISLLLTPVTISFMTNALSIFFPPLSSDTSQLGGVTLTSAVTSSGPVIHPAPWVETCSCPLGFAGQFCEECAPGFTREVPGRGLLSTCVPCNCHHHGTCHPETGNK